MSNLIRYIIQEDPEKEMRKKTWEKPTYSSIVAPREEIEASKKRSQNLLESALSSYNTKQTPTPWAKKQSNNLLERMSMTTPSAPKRLEPFCGRRYRFRRDKGFWRRNRTGIFKNGKWNEYE